MAESICTHCGYEGTPIRRPSDHSEDDDSLWVGILNKLFFMLTFIPLKFGWIPRLAKRGKAKTCPNCGLPLMVKLSSDRGWLAKRKHDIKSGLIVVDEEGNVRPGEPKQVLVVAPAPEDPGVLPPLQALLEKKAEPKAAAEESSPEPVPVKREKPVNPDQW
ncbi:MAG: hypothetical protein ACOYNL_04900 [Rickettsiales bacterium]